ncbi:MAG: 16S rRNA (adenine(1518)-N(6)/adenine(1519)-N(6))-dimethyltransferase RsmA [Firmicutes bacterium]|nr:16S rRNA (adenine(1518)-N(6)/adenine(1519)-N(6))-dimethyltransferase RsmA [Bacillota bacterium]
MDYSPKKMQSNLKEHQFRFKKNYGQNFIVDANIIQKIVSSSDIDDKTMVLEIGPGAGSLTVGLCESAKNVLCYEIDTSLENVLEEQLKPYSNVEVVYEDFLKANVREKMKEYSFEKLYVIGNLPYYITTPIIMKVIEEKLPVDKIVVMVQKEVGDRLKAVSGTRDYGSLTVFLNYYFDVRKLLDVSRNVFLPKPNVDSIVVELKRKENDILLKDETFFFQLVKDSFKQKRKTIRNNLKAYDLSQIESLLKEKGYDLSVRAEQLLLEVFVHIANGYQK